MVGAKISKIPHGCATGRTMQKALLNAQNAKCRFRAYYVKFEEQTTINGYTASTVYNYSLALAKISLYFKKVHP